MLQYITSAHRNKFYICVLAVNNIKVNLRKLILHIVLMTLGTARKRSGKFILWKM
jgi:hypothetical protein